MEDTFTQQVQRREDEQGTSSSCGRGSRRGKSIKRASHQRKRAIRGHPLRAGTSASSSILDAAEPPQHPPPSSAVPRRKRRRPGAATPPPSPSGSFSLPSKRRCENDSVTNSAVDKTINEDPRQPTIVDNTRKPCVDDLIMNLPDSLDSATLLPAATDMPVPPLVPAPSPPEPVYAVWDLLWKRPIPSEWQVNPEQHVAAAFIPDGEPREQNIPDDFPQNLSNPPLYSGSLFSGEKMFGSASSP